MIAALLPYDGNTFFSTTTATTTIGHRAKTSIKRAGCVSFSFGVLAMISCPHERMMKNR
jgi:hypothetical protein